MKKLELNQMENLSGGGCAFSAFMFAVACVGLATLEAGSGGLATGAVIVGYVGASVDVTKACR